MSSLSESHRRVINNLTILMNENARLKKQLYDKESMQMLRRIKPIMRRKEKVEVSTIKSPTSKDGSSRVVPSSHPNYSLQHEVIMQFLILKNDSTDSFQFFVSETNY